MGLNFNKLLQTVRVGDKIEAVANATGIATAVHFIEKKTGKDCGCKRRKQILNGGGNEKPSTT